MSHHLQELEENFKKNGGSFKKFKVGELFNIKTGRDLIIGKTKDGEIPLVSHQNTNNGIVRTISKEDDRIIFDHKKTIALADRGIFYATSQSKDFYIGTRVKALIWKKEELSESIRLYLTSSINKLQVMFKDYLTNATDKLPFLHIILPTKNNEIAFDYMQDYVRELEQDYVRELDNYLKVTGLDSYELTEEERDCIELKLDFKDYILSDLFTKKTVKGVPKSEENLTENKSGFLMYGQNIKPQYPQKILLDEKYLQKVEPNQPILGYTSSVGEIGMIEESFYRSGNNGAFQGLFAKEHKYNKYELLYVLTILRKYFNDFGYATSMANIMDLMVKLPIKQNAINYSFMETYIKAVEKLVIKDLVDWKNKVINTTKEYVNTPI